MKISNVLKNKILCVAIFLQFFLLTIRQAFLFIAPNSIIVRYFFIFCSAIPIVLSFPIIMKRKAFVAVMLYVGFFSCVFVSIIFHPSTMVYFIENFFDIVCMCFPSFLCMICIDDFSVLYQYGKRFSYYIFFGSMIYVACNFLLGGSIVEKINYNMSLGYKMLLPAVLFFYYFLKEKKIIYMFLSFFITCIILILGSRGPVACVGLYVFLSVLFQRKNLKLKCAFFICCMIVFFVFQDSIDLLIEFLADLGINARSLRYLTSGIFFSNTSGRDVLFDIGLNGFYDNFYVGMGIYGDRLLNNGVYIHNFVLEILIQYGFIIGITILVIFFAFLLYKIFISSNRLYILALLCFGFIHLFLSSSYLQDASFYIFLGSLFNRNITNVNIGGY